MDTRLFDFIHEKTPKFNRVICDGLAVEHLKFVEEYVDRLLRSAQASFPRGLIYHGYARCTPWEQYMTSTRMRSSKRSYEISRSDVYLVKYMFRYHGNDIRPMFLYLPYVTDGGIIRIRGATYSISPVLADQTISDGVDSLFVKLYKDKLTFNRSVYGFMIDNERTHTDLIISNIHHNARKNTSKRVPGFDATPPHYLFCKFGVTRAFKDFANAQVYVGLEDTINTEKFPADEWSICSSLGLKPRGIKDKDYVPSKLRMAIRKEDYNHVTAIMIGSFFYIVDHFPSQVDPDCIDITDTWLILLGVNATGAETKSGKILISMNTHMESLDQYVDILSRKDLEEIGIHVTDIYQLFAYVIKTMSARIAAAGTTISSMYGKKLTVLYYLLQDINDAISNMHFAWRKKTKGDDSRVLTEKDIFEKYVPVETILRISGSEHREVSNVSSSTGNKIFRITTSMRLQSEVVSGKSDDTVSVDDPMGFLHTSQAEIASFSILSRTSLTGRDTLNPFARIEPNGRVERNPDFIQLLDQIQQNIKR